MSILTSILKRGAKGIDAGMTALDKGLTAAYHGVSAVDDFIATNEMKNLKGINKKISNTLTPDLSKLASYDNDGYVSGLSLRGKALLGGIAAVGAAGNAFDQRNINNMGTLDRRMMSPTPDFSSYNQKNNSSSSYQGAPAGADGSLVFALDKTKNGGFL